MQVWRICRKKHEASAFNGKGAEQTGGRWNHKGHRVVYASENLSLAVLELFVHLSPEVMPSDLVAIRATLPKRFTRQELTEADFPTNWRSYPAPGRLQTLGTDWLRGRKTLALLVPSAINPMERNVLLNPAHPQMAAVRVERGRAFRFDPRLFGT